MKSFPANPGPFGEQPYYTQDEIDRICREELIGVDLLPSCPEPVRIERFIEKRFRVTVSYEDLPPGVLGYTRFGPKGVEQIVVSRGLAEEPGRVAERRVTSTLAHEAGHCLLHGHLFAIGDEPVSLFNRDKDVTRERVLCRDEHATTGGGRAAYAGRWWEVQANKAIAGLLLPRALVVRCVQPFLEKGTLGVDALSPSRRSEAERALSEAFAVNPVVARIRLGGLFPEIDRTQLTL